MSHEERHMDPSSSAENDQPSPPETKVIEGGNKSPDRNSTAREPPLTLAQHEAIELAKLYARRQQTKVGNRRELVRTVNLLGILDRRAYVSSCSKTKGRLAGH